MRGSYTIVVKFLCLLNYYQKTILQALLILDCGRISISKNGQARYAVNSINDLIFKVVPFFTDHQLYGKKRLDLAL